MIAGGAEATVSPLGVGGFAAARALSHAQRRSRRRRRRPWDKDRDGFVLGEGAGVLVLEEYEHAKARGARIYAELIGYGMSADAYHMTAPPKTATAPRALHGQRAAQRAASTPTRSTTSTRTARRRRSATSTETIAHQARVRRSREEAGRQLDQVDDRPPARRRRRHRVGVHRAGDARPGVRRRRSTSSTRIRSATSTTAPTRRGR